MIDQRPLERDHESESSAPFTLELLAWEPRREEHPVAKAIVGLLLGVGLASAGAFMILDRVGMPTPDGVPQLLSRAALVAAPHEAPVASALGPTPFAHLARVPATPPVILATAVVRTPATRQRPPAAQVAGAREVATREVAGARRVAAGARRAGARPVAAPPVEVAPAPRPDEAGPAGADEDASVIYDEVTPPSVAPPAAADLPAESPGRDAPAGRYEPGQP